MGGGSEGAAARRLSSDQAQMGATRRFAMHEAMLTLALPSIPVRAVDQDEQLTSSCPAQSGGSSA
ncbi:hypothetical protein PEP31012_01708 [Pandoraea eparura]|uniref:Uncharacterized protein n=1 Tax=Pandoraea eparura TaxID=2508291 RepID=A0A5E4U0B9_9BURK|nr:hypothetical protein PEP31012_01708 [Pandoraea eparura]